MAICCWDYEPRLCDEDAVFSSFNLGHPVGGPSSLMVVVGWRCDQQRTPGKDGRVRGPRSFSEIIDRYTGYSLSRLCLA